MLTGAILIAAVLFQRRVGTQAGTT
jgi:hypothetical protein